MEKAYVKVFGKIFFTPPATLFEKLSKTLIFAFEVIVQQYHPNTHLTLEFFRVLAHCAAGIIRLKALSLSLHADLLFG